MENPPTLRFDFVVPSRTVFGWGRRAEVGALARSLGNRAFLICGSRSLEQSGVLSQIESALQKTGVSPVRVATISHEPLTADVDDCVDRLLQFHPCPGDLVVAIG